MKKTFALLLFSTDPEFIRQAVASGAGGVVVDWERIGKERRQRHFDTQISPDTFEDLRRVRACTAAPVLCRINGWGVTTADEVEAAIGAGADEILLPMVRTVEEVQTVLGRVRGRCGVGILIETKAAVRLAEQLADLPLSRVYVGLNDLAIDRDTPNIFTALADGTVERLRHLIHVPFGFGGLTLPDRGSPIPCRLLIGEMARLQCDFSVLRRSFHRDIQGSDMAFEIPRLLEAIRQAHLRLPEAVAHDRHEVEKAISLLPDPALVEGFSRDGRTAR